MKIRLYKIIGFISIGFLITSCDKEHIKEYYAQNDSLEEIEINFKVEEINDSITVESSETKLIYTRIYYFGTVGVNDDRFEDEISEVQIQRDTVTTEIDEALWEYEEVSKYYARYTLIIN